MKAVELLRLYEAGRRNFRGENLKGQNFQGKDLSGADFSSADIRSANFTSTNLRGGNFSEAKAGLQKKRIIILLGLVTFLLVISSLFSAAIAAVLLGYITNPDDPGDSLGGWPGLVMIIFFWVIALRRGIITSLSFAALTFALAFAGTFAGSFIFTGAVGGAVAFSIAFSGVVAVATAVVFIFTVVFTFANAIAMPLMVIGVFTAVFSVVCFVTGVLTTAIAVAFVVLGLLLSAYIGRRASKGDRRDTWFRTVAVAFATIGGTSFRCADLTDADFTKAQLKSTDFRWALLRRTRWEKVIELDKVRPGETYLNNPKIQKLLTTGNGQGQDYDHLLNLRGINLAGANLEGADFSGSLLKHSTFQGAKLMDTNLIGSNLNDVNLQDVDLSRAKLVQTQLDDADLTGANLTGATIEDWGITTTTKLHGVQCNYVFMRLPPEDNSDPNPHRKPDDWNKTFAEGEFVDFITPLVETLDLYHNQTVDPRAMAIAFNDLRDKNPDTGLNIVSMEKRGKNRDKFLLKVEANSQANFSQLHGQYFENYDHLLTLPPQVLQALLIEKDKHAKMLAGMIETAIAQPKTNIEKIETQGDTTVAESNSGTSKYDMRGVKFAGGFAETVQGDQIGGTQYNYDASDKQSLAEAAAEIQTLLKQLEQTTPTESMSQKMALATQAIAQIESNPTLKQRAVAALSAGGMKAFEAAIDHPIAAFVVGAIEGWKDAG